MTEDKLSRTARATCTHTHAPTLLECVDISYLRGSTLGMPEIDLEARSDVSFKLETKPRSPEARSELRMPTRLQRYRDCFGGLISFGGAPRCFAALRSWRRSADDKPSCLRLYMMPYQDALRLLHVGPAPPMTLRENKSSCEVCSRHARH